ncbi:MAG: amidase [Alphaproteobacteria bacterium]|nr:amidase [Alphaproteobacteria bacterium]
MTELAYLTVAQAAERLRRRDLSPVEYVTALLRRVDGLDGRLHSFVRLLPEQALAAARTAEAEIAKGAWRGPFHGIPTGLKDIVDLAGVPTTAQSRILLDNVAAADAAVTASLKAAGAVIMGKMATHEFACGGHTSFDTPFPPAVNPWKDGYFPGSSSSGPGAGLAAGFVAAAIGTDTGGSIRNPASACSLVGLKPTYGRVSRRGVMPLAYSLDHAGPMTRDVRDNALMLQVIAGHDPADPGSVERAVPDYAAGLEAGVKGLRIGVVRHFYQQDSACDPEMLAAIEAAIALYGKLGAEICDVALAPLADYGNCLTVILAAESYAVHEKWLQERPQDYAVLTRQRLLQGAFVRASDYVQAMRWRGLLARELDAKFRDVDVLLTASSFDPPPPLASPEVGRVLARQSRMPFNISGHPAIAVPAGFSKAGLPLSFQLAGRYFDEAMLYRVARAYERECGWHERHPDLTAAAAA